jgi:DnaJ-class molecular chaperone
MVHELKCWPEYFKAVISAGFRNGTDITMDATFSQREEKCPNCNGLGYMDDAFGYPIGSECQTCHGTGKRTIKESLRVDTNQIKPEALK